MLNYDLNLQAMEVIIKQIILLNNENEFGLIQLLNNNLKSFDNEVKLLAIYLIQYLTSDTEQLKGEICDLFFERVVEEGIINAKNEITIACLMVAINCL